MASLRLGGDIRPKSQKEEPVETLGFRGRRNAGACPAGYVMVRTFAESAELVSPMKQVTQVRSTWAFDA